MEPLLEGLLRSLGGSEANLLDVCLGRIPYGNFHTKATSKKSRAPSGNFRPNPPELPRSPSRSFSRHETGWRILLVQARKKAHKHIFFGPVALRTTPGMSQGQTSFVPGTNPLCPRDKPRFPPYFAQWKPRKSQGQTQFVPGTIPGQRAPQKVYVLSLCAFLTAVKQRGQERKGPPDIPPKSFSPKNGALFFP